MKRYDKPFSPVNSTAPSFNMTADSTSAASALESTGVRQWSGPSGRAIRLASLASDDFYVAFGDSNIVSQTTDSMLVLGNTVEIFKQVVPSDTHIAVVSSTDVTVNVTLGYGQ